MSKHTTGPLLQTDDFSVIHMPNMAAFKRQFWKDCGHGSAMDAPEVMPIGATTNGTQDLVERGFNAFTAYVETVLLRGYGETAYMTPFEYECYFNKPSHVAIAKVGAA